MPRFLCSSCHEVVEMSGSGRFDWCSSCGEPLSAEDRLPVRLVSGPSQASGGPAGVADLAAPALATTTNPIAATSRTPKVSPSTT
jgi:hypothetical protein